MLQEIEIVCDKNFSKSRPGKRNIIDKNHTLNHFLIQKEIYKLLKPFFQTPFKPVRTIYFTKTTEANWFVPWHQDLTVSLKEKREHPDFRNWTQKDGIPHAEAPLSLLEQMVTLRVFLDPSDENNGGLWVLPESHKNGRIKQIQIKKVTQSGLKEFCLTGERGSVYLFSPLLLHRSGKSKTDKPRRVLQIELAPEESLPSHLEWYEDSQIIPPNS